MQAVDCHNRSAHSFDRCIEPPPPAPSATVHVKDLLPLGHRHVVEGKVADQQLADGGATSQSLWLLPAIRKGGPAAGRLRVVGGGRSAEDGEEAKRSKAVAASGPQLSRASLSVHCRFSWWAQQMLRIQSVGEKEAEAEEFEGDEGEEELG
ncbi:hypothetical protein TYRP_016578 [Tyrophagus putrescentiae]|nr:hypothetical protein TYRP_016578 [Tyrophagus putrescentiae]